MTMTQFALMTLAIGVLASCATNAPQPTEAMTRAETSIEQADQAGARRFDPGNLDTSKAKLAQAKAAADKGNPRIANRLAEQAELDAELAAATARSASAKEAALQMRAGTETLRTETLRTETPRPTSP